MAVTQSCLKKEIDMNARTFDLTPLNRAFIGFDPIFNLMDRHFANSINNTGGYPPYNILQLDNNNYQIEIAVAGFNIDELSITQNKNELLIEGQPTLREFQEEEHIEWKENDEPKHYLHKGIANRTFKRTFTLADYVEIKDAKLELGILTIKLERQVPEELKPKRITINSVE
jgi:molecular chaperone IbpA